MRLLMLPLVLAMSLLLAAFAQAQDDIPTPPDKLQDLTTQPDRQQLFAFVKQAAEADDPALAKEALQEFNLYGPFRFPNDTLFDVVENKARTNSIFGVDISHHNKPGFPFARLANKRVKFVYVKATQGRRFKSPTFAAYWRELGKQETHKGVVHRGAYHFLSAGVDPAAQAKSFIDFLNMSGGLTANDMPPVLDLEWDKASQSAPDRWQNVKGGGRAILEAAKIWLQVVEEATGRRPMVYTARSWWRERVGDDGTLVSELKGYPIWIADYSKSSRGVEVPKVMRGSNWHLWQFTESGEMAQGYDGAFDTNVFKGSEDEFYQTFGIARY